MANLTNTTCRSPWSIAQLEDYGQTEAGSIMHSLTRHNPVTCLSASDMSGLYLLYPVCDEVIPEEVSCSKARRLSGFLRLASVVGVPLGGRSRPSPFDAWLPYMWPPSHVWSRGAGQARWSPGLCNPVGRQRGALEKLAACGGSP